MHGAITIRHRTDDDGPAVRHLAQLDDRPAPQGDALLAFVDGELAAARPSSGTAVGGRPVPPHRGGPRAARPPGHAGARRHEPALAGKSQAPSSAARR